MKRYASHYIYLAGYGFLKGHAIELNEKHGVCRIFPFTGEVESTEWLPGVIALFSDNNKTEIIKAEGMIHEIPSAFSINNLEKTSIFYKAYIYTPFNFTSMQPYDGTQHRLLL